MTQTFSHRQARSTPIMVTFAVLIILETVAAHLLLLRYSLLLALAVSLLSLSALAWLVADYLALSRLNTIITDESLILRVGRRARATIPRKLLTTAISPSWSDLPDAPSRTYLNVTKPAEPNVLLSFSEPVIIKLPGGLRRSIRMLAVFVDTPEAFLAAIQSGKNLANEGAA
jgi:hypothetical protein